jgi:hypothetical protein
MDILVQHEKAKLFLAGTNEWTARRECAVNFSTSLEALQYCLEHRLREIVLLFCYQNSKLDFTISPFSEHEPMERTTFSAIHDAVYYRANSLQLKLENRKLRQELNSLIAEGKERRKRRVCGSSVADGSTQLDGCIKPSLAPSSPRIFNRAPRENLSPEYSERVVLSALIRSTERTPFPSCQNPG